MLNPKQEQFCLEYLIDLNGKQAAIRAGYSPKTAESQASTLLRNPKVASRVQELKAQRVERTEISADFVLMGLKTVAERCMQAAPVIDWDHKSKGWVQKSDKEGNLLFEFDSQGANRAFELLGKHVGVFEKDNKQKVPEGQAGLPSDQFQELLKKVRATTSNKGK